MNLLEILADIYEENQSLFFEEMADKNGGVTALLPIPLQYQNAHIDCIVDSYGHIVEISLLDKEVAAVAMMPHSLSRTLNIAAHLIHDQLVYVAKDMPTYTTIDNTRHTSDYFQQLDHFMECCQHPSVLAIASYLKKGTLIQDLIHWGVLPSLNKKIPMKSPEKGLWPIYKILPREWYKACVRFRYLGEDGECIELTKIPEVVQAAESFFLEQCDVGFCYIRRKLCPTLKTHPRNIRYRGDKSRIIASPSKCSYNTFSGWFQMPEDCFSLGAEVSLKAHNSLQWLIQKQGIEFDNVTHLFFSHGADKKPTFDVYDSLLDGLQDEEENKPPYPLSELVTAAIRDGFKGGITLTKKMLSNTNEIVYYLALQSNVESRLAILTFTELAGHELLKNLQQWDRLMRIRSVYTQETQVISVYQLIHAMFDKELSPALFQAETERIMRVITEGRPLSAAVKIRLKEQFNRKAFLTRTEQLFVLRVLVAVIQFTRAEADDIKLNDYRLGECLGLVEHLGANHLNAVVINEVFHVKQRAREVIAKKIKELRHKLGEENEKIHCLMTLWNQIDWAETFGEDVYIGYLASVDKYGREGYVK